MPFRLPEAAARPPRRRRTAVLPAVLGVALGGCLGGCVGSDPSEPVKKVMVIGIDGVRPDVLTEAATPHLDELIEEGAFTDRARTGFPSVSGPGWSSLLIGVWSDKHGVTSNDFHSNNYGEYPDFITRIESVRPELETFVVADWLPLVDDDSGGPVFGDAPDTKVVLDGYGLGWAEADEQGTTEAVGALTGGDPDALFVYLGNPDETSHHFQSIGGEYRLAIEEADRQVGRLVEAMRSRDTFAEEDWLILVSTDHGRTADGDHGGDTGEERTIFFIAHGPSVEGGSIAQATAIVDVAVTALVHMGVDIAPEWQLDGKVVGIRP